MPDHDEKPPRDTGAEALIQMLGVYQVDLLAEVEGVLRSLSRMQQQVHPGARAPVERRLTRGR